MKVAINGERCSGHGRCYSLAPDVYTSDEVGYNSEKDSGVPIEVVPGKEAVARLGAEMCPERAIAILDD